MDRHAKKAAWKKKHREELSRMETEPRTIEVYDDITGTRLWAIGPTELEHFKDAYDADKSYRIIIPSAFLGRPD